MKLAIFSVLILIGCGQVYAQSEITAAEIAVHVEYLASEELRGRFPGTKENRKAVKYIRKDFRKSGIGKINGSYLQEFEAKIRVKKGVKDTPVVKTWNVVGLIEGSDAALKNEYIVLGAHYDHLGMGSPSSKRPDTVAVHHGADDNASGTAALLEIAEKLAAKRHLLKRSILVVAFGAEEQGLLGSKYITEHPPVPLNQIRLMINMDMVGRLNEEGHIYMGGAGTFSQGMELMKTLGPEFDLKPIVHAGEVGGSDHVSFYRKDISVLGLHTGGHPQYHTPEDKAELINAAGEKRVCDYIYKAILTLSARAEPIDFIKQN